MIRAGGKGPVITILLQDTDIQSSKVMNKLVVLTILLVTAVTESKAQNKSSDHDLVNEVNHVQVGVCLFEKEFKIMRAWVPGWIFDVSIHWFSFSFISFK